MKKWAAILILFFSGLACATAAAPAPHKYGVNSALVGIESKTVFNATASSAKQVVFGRAHAFVELYSRGGTFWVRRRSPDETSGVLPTNPIPSANTVSSEWVRISDAEKRHWGVEGVAATQNEQTLFIDVWPETSGGDLEIVAH